MKKFLVKKLNDLAAWWLEPTLTGWRQLHNDHIANSKMLRAHCEHQHQQIVLNKIQIDKLLAERNGQLH